MLVLWLIAVGAILARIARRHALSLRGVSALDVNKFAIIWWALLLAAPAAVVALAAFSFALFLTPWYKLPLLEQRLDA